MPLVTGSWTVVSLGSPPRSIRGSDESAALLSSPSSSSSSRCASSSSLKSTGTTTSFSSALKSASEKETTKPVEGQQYAEILTGPRAGMYLNTSGGSRDGEAFILVKHDGREDHIYGTGRDRKVVSVGADASEKSSSSSSDKTSSSGKVEAAPADETITGADSLALALVELHLSLLQITAVVCPANTIDR